MVGRAAEGRGRNARQKWGVKGGEVPYEGPPRLAARGLGHPITQEVGEKRAASLIGVVG